MLRTMTNNAIQKPCIRATLYIACVGKPHLTGIFSAKLCDSGYLAKSKPCQLLLPIKHFSPYFNQLVHNTFILTNSKSCVQAYEKLCCGEFSASPWVSIFLSTVSCYQASLYHVSGSAILPSDFSSRNTPNCKDIVFKVMLLQKKIRKFSYPALLKTGYPKWELSICHSPIVRPGS